MAQSVCYYREHGIVCYSLPLFVASERPYRRVADDFRKAVLASNLGWCWRSSVRELADPDTDPALQDGCRPLTPLSAATYDEFAADIQYIDDWDNGKEIELFAYDPDISSFTIVEDSNLRIALTNFATHEEGPIRLVIVTLDDEENSLVFVPHSPVPFVEKLLEIWNAPWVRENNRHKYDALRIVKLETMYSLPINHEGTQKER